MNAEQPSQQVARKPKPCCEREAVAERRRRVVAMTEQGLSAAQIAQQLRVTARTVVRYRVTCNVAKPGPVPLTEDEKRVAETLLDDGCSCSEVARSIGRSVETILHHFPGRAWTRQQASEFAIAVRMLGALK